MTGEETIKLLSEHATEIRKQFGVTHLRLFGSVTRNQSDETSDVDVLVEFDGPATFNGYFDLKFFLEDLSGRNVDLVTETGLRPAFRQYVEEDAIEVTA